MPSPSRRPRRVLVYGDVDLNVLDGSAVWATAVAETLARAGAAVTFVLKAKVVTDRLVAPLLEVPNLTVVRPFEDGHVEAGRATQLDRPTASDLLARLDRDERADLILLRGRALIEQVVADGHFDGRIWAYLTDVPQTVLDMTDDDVDRLGRVARASRAVLCQTEELRGFLEMIVPAMVGRCELLPPSIPALADPDDHVPDPDRPLRLVYAGKFAPAWRTEEMTRLPAMLAAAGRAAEVHLIGDKIHRVPDDPEYQARMAAALTTTPDVVWHRGMGREAALARISEMDIGLGWRARSLDASLELSTKVLEYAALGRPAVLARTPPHERLLGPDYPGFANDAAEVVDAVLALADPATYRLAAQRGRDAASAYTMERAVARVRDLLEQTFPTVPALVGRERPIRLVVAGYDFKFIDRLIDRFRAMDGLEVRIDAWKSRVKHDPDRSRDASRWADVVLCEWCGPNAVWYAAHRRPGQRIYVRLHRYELTRAWPYHLDIDRIARVYCVSDDYRARTLQATEWPEDRVGAIPNWVDVRQLDRPKLEGARTTIGMIGVGEVRKRLDLALDVLDRVRRQDPRFRLVAKTKMVWEYPQIWARPAEQAHARELLTSLARVPGLHDAVTFDAFGPAVAAWLRRVGFVLSTSDDESFHLAVAEGMASGAVPVILDRDGADATYASRWIHDDTAAMADAILEAVEPGRWAAASEAAQAEIRDTYALDTVARRWAEVFAGGE